MTPSVITVLIFAATFPSGSQSASDPPAPPTPLAALDLIAAYRANTVAADDRYKRQTVTFSGKVGNMTKSLFGTPHVLVGDGSDRPIDQVDATFDRANRNTLAKLHRGDVITIQCRIAGYRVVGYTAGVVVAKKCVFAPD